MCEKTLPAEDDAVATAAAATAAGAAAEAPPTPRRFRRLLRLRNRLRACSGSCNLSRICLRMPTSSSSTLCWMPLDVSMNLQSNDTASDLPSDCIEQWTPLSSNSKRQMRQFSALIDREIPLCKCLLLTFIHPITDAVFHDHLVESIQSSSQICVY